MNTDYLLKSIRSHNIEVKEQEFLAAYTTFKIGGKATLFALPQNEEEIQFLLQLCDEQQCPYFVLGGGSNVLISDDGFHGLIISLKKFNKIALKHEGDASYLVGYAGAMMQECCEFALAHSLQGLEYIYGMPGSLGGALWMNARCYGSEISQQFVEASFITAEKKEIIGFEAAQWSYKQSPFQHKEGIIGQIKLRLNTGDQDPINAIMQNNRQDRKQKGHFDYPCGGSFYKNNRDFNMPSGQLIDQRHWRGKTVGGALVSPKHANFLVNATQASAEDVDELARKIEADIYGHYGFELEREVQKVGIFKNDK